ncbi:MAG: zinc ABC transporter solute-binding protein [Acidimicrobiaceae bacterium]|nr:zinc ABC transporter solute-binding protein [Acidimicrobiaceae bacterium]
MVLENRQKRSRIVVGAALILGSLTLAACGSTSATPGVIQVVGAEVQYGDVLAQIGGPYVHVTSMMNNPNTDPHNFEASPSVARAIASAQLIVQNGAGYDSFMNQLEAASSSSSRVVVTMAQLLHQTTVANPHFWYSPSALPTLAQVVATDLVKIDPSHAAYFRATAVAFQSSWRPVTMALATASRDLAHRPVATTEPVGDYLLSAIGLNNLTPFRFQADVMNGIDPSPQDIVTQQNLLNNHQVGALCFNAQVSSPVTTALRNLAVKDKVPLVAIYETMPAGQHVQGWMLEEIRAIEAALTHGVSTVSFA